MLTIIENNPQKNLNIKKVIRNTLSYRNLFTKDKEVFCFLVRTGISTLYYRYIFYCKIKFFFLFLQTAIIYSEHRST